MLDKGEARAACAVRGRSGKRPVIHCLSSPVTSALLAHGLLAVGASAMMAEDRREMKEAASRADALLLNLGMLTEGRLAAMCVAGKMARKCGLPCLLDPVALGLSAFRQKACRKLIALARPWIIRGNYEEMTVLAEILLPSAGGRQNKGQKRGDLARRPSGGGRASFALIDADERSEVDLLRLQELAVALDCVLLASGASDYIVTADASVQVEGGSPCMRRISGAGCLQGALLAFVLAGERREDTAELAASFCHRYKTAARQAEEKMRKEDSAFAFYPSYLLDELSLVFQGRALL